MGIASESGNLISSSSKNFKSFVDVINCTSSDCMKEKNLAGFSNPSIESSNSPDVFLDPFSTGKFPVTRKDDKPAIILTDEDVCDLAQPFRLTLVGKFLVGRPKWDIVQAVFKNLKLKGKIRCFNLDVRHFVIYLNHIDDYISLFVKQRMVIHGFPLKIFKWTPEFSFDTESSIVPVWILLPMLKLHLFNRSMLFSIAAIYGIPLKLDFATSQCLRPGCARVLVELDLRKHHEQEIWIGSDASGYMQQVMFQNLPVYCFHCRKLGHTDSTCFHLHPELNLSQTDVRKKDLQSTVTKNSGISLIQKDSFKAVETLVTPVEQHDKIENQPENIVTIDSSVDIGFQNLVVSVNKAASVGDLVFDGSNGIQFLNLAMKSGIKEVNDSFELSGQQSDIKVIDSNFHMMNSFSMEIQSECSNQDAVGNKKDLGRDVQLDIALLNEPNKNQQFQIDGQQSVDMALSETDYGQQMSDVLMIHPVHCYAEDSDVQNSVQSNEQQMNSGKFLTSVFVGEVLLQAVAVEDSNEVQNPFFQQDSNQIKGSEVVAEVAIDGFSSPIFLDNGAEAFDIRVENKERHLWVDEVEEQMILNNFTLREHISEAEDVHQNEEEEKLTLNNITLGEQISEVEDVHQINKVKEILSSNEMNCDLGHNFQDFSKHFYLKASSTKSLGDKADPEGEESFYQILQDKGKHLGKENFYRSPIITRSHTKGVQQEPDGYESDSWLMEKGDMMDAV